MITQLTQRRCSQACGAKSLSSAETDALLRELGGGWSLAAGPRLGKEFRFPDFLQALAFVNKVGALAQEENHHPDLQLAWGKVQVSLWTHSAGGLTENDFILAAKIDALPGPAR